MSFPSGAELNLGWPRVLCFLLSREESESRNTAFLLSVLEPFVKWSCKHPCFSFLTLSGVSAGIGLAPWGLAWEGAAALALLLLWLPWLRLRLAFGGSDSPGGWTRSRGFSWFPAYSWPFLRASQNLPQSGRRQTEGGRTSDLSATSRVSGLQRKPLGHLEFRDTNAIPQTWHPMNVSNKNVNEHRMKEKPLAIRLGLKKNYLFVCDVEGTG